MKRKKADPEDFSFRPFRQLKSSITEQSARTVPKKESPAPPPPPPSDHDIFTQAMKDVREIKEFREISVRKKTAKTIRRKEHPDREALKTLEGIAQGRLPIKLADTQEYVEWMNSDYDVAPTIIRKLHEGRFAVQDLLDLHGYTVDEADIKIADFMRNSLMRSLRCVRIIHGRGLKSQHGPVLKGALLNFLSGRYKKNVIAFVTARQCDGGLGALYVLLKQQSPAKR
jgi:DNA-nicking Smr family endonuclease